MRLKQHYSAVVLVGLLALGTGCSERGPEFFPVAGRVTYNGEPLPYGTIMFQPDKGPIAVGELQPDGSYKLISGADQQPGAVSGMHRVSFQPPPKKFLVPPEELETRHAPPPVEEQPFVPAKFHSPATSGLTAAVKPGSNEINFDLP